MVQPVKRALNEKMTNVIALTPVEVQGRAPGRVVKICEVRAVLVEVVSFRPKMVVDHIETHCELLRVRRVNEFLQFLDTAVAVLHRERKYAVVSPIPPPGKL